jgi:pyruvate dehydrogenase E1 component
VARAGTTSDDPRKPTGAALVTVGDFHPPPLSWLGAVAQNPIVPLGVDRFGQSGEIPDLYRAYAIAAERSSPPPPAPASWRRAGARTDHDCGVHAAS